MRGAAAASDGLTSSRTAHVCLDAAERLTALVEGLSQRWLSGSITLVRAQHLLAGALNTELGTPR